VAGAAAIGMRAAKQKFKVNSPQEKPVHMEARNSRTSHFLANRNQLKGTGDDWLGQAQTHLSHS